jgi:hypothetical protein
VGVWAVWGCGVTPYVRHSTDCTCCDFGRLRFYDIKSRTSLNFDIISQKYRLLKNDIKNINILEKVI